MLSVAEVRAIVAAAHRRDRLVTAHVSDDLGVWTALERIQLVVAGGMVVADRGRVSLPPG